MSNPLSDTAIDGFDYGLAPAAGSAAPGLNTPSILAQPDVSNDLPIPALPSLPTLPSLPSLPGAGAPTPPAPVAFVAPSPAPEMAPAMPPPNGEMPTLPTLPTVAPTVHGGVPSVAPDLPAPNPAGGEPRHPMADLMGEQPARNQASIRAAEVRAAKKAKARRTKIIALVVFVAVAALVGPPLVKWLTNAIDESGKVSKDPVATTVAPAAAVTTAPGLLGAIDAAENVVSSISAPATVPAASAPPASAPATVPAVSAPPAASTAAP